MSDQLLVTPKACSATKDTCNQSIIETEINTSYTQANPEVDFTAEQVVDLEGNPGSAAVEINNIGSRSAENQDPDKTLTQSAQTSTHKNNLTNLVIIDNIRQSWKYKSSSSIKREFTKYFPNIRIQLAYSLKAGGIALHLANPESAKQVSSFLWPLEAFGDSGDQLYCHTASNRPKVILKNVNTKLSEEELGTIIQNVVTEKVLVKRFHYRDTGKRLPVIKVTCSEEASDRLLKCSLKVYGRDIEVEPFKTIHRREITCFNCRDKGHIARVCLLLTGQDGDESGTV